MQILQGFGIVLAVALGLFIIGIAIYIVSRRPGGATIPTALMPSRKTIQNAAWIFGSYLICLWAFSALWPDAWDAWRGKGFWVTQLLIISVIGFIASKWIGEKGIRWVAWIPGAMAILLTVTTISNNLPSKKNRAEDLAEKWLERIENSFSKPDSSIVVTKLPAQYDTTVTLIRGKINPPLKVPVWYNYEISDPGKPFGHRVENHEKVDTMGGGHPYIRPSEHVRNFSLFTLENSVDDSLNITVYFSRK